MFELLSNVQSIPIDQDSIAMVHRGMNKVRVSVGEHNSEPSEVYIITGWSKTLASPGQTRLLENLETYVIFYMLEPGIQVVYGCDENPYAPTLKEPIIEEAIIFVEEMGSILEEIPWDNMTADQRSSWVEKENLYAPLVIDELEEVEEFETVEVASLEDEVTEEALLEADLDLDPEDDVVEISEDEFEQALSDSESDDMLQVSQEVDEIPMGVGLETGDMEKDDLGGIKSAGKEDVVVAEGDFDELLRQAFLKPDVAEKTKFKKRKMEAVKIEEEQTVPEIADDDESGDLLVEEEAELSGVFGNDVLEKELETPGKPEAAYDAGSAPSREGKAADVAEVSPRANDRALSEQDSRLMVIRFLSRF
jgi:hypothetical protein